MVRFLKITALVVGVVLIIGLIVVCWVYRATQRPVVWYEEILDTEPKAAETAGDELEKRALALVSDVKRPLDRWEALFSNDEINGWLAVDLPQKHSRDLPSGVSDPRVMITPGGGRVACRYETPKFATVLNMQTEIYLTDEPNVVAIRICNVRAGGLPLPVGQLLEEATTKAEGHGFRVLWTEQGGDPLALVTLPEHYRGVPGRLRLETLALGEGEVYLAGRTIPNDEGK